MSCRLDLPDRLHESVPYDDADVGARVAVRFARQLAEVGFAQAVRRVAKVKSEHLGPGLLLRERDVDPLLESDATEINFNWTVSSWEENLWLLMLRNQATQPKTLIVTSFNYSWLFHLFHIFGTFHKVSLKSLK